jgi:hypothetical protein
VVKGDEEQADPDTQSIQSEGVISKIVQGLLQADLDERQN